MIPVREEAPEAMPDRAARAIPDSAPRSMPDRAPRSGLVVMAAPFARVVGRADRAGRSSGWRGAHRRTCVVVGRGMRISAAAAAAVTRRATADTVVAVEKPCTRAVAEGPCAPT